MKSILIPNMPFYFDIFRKMLIFTVFIAISELFATFPKMKFREYTMFLGNRRFRQKGKTVFDCYGVAFFIWI